MFWKLVDYRRHIIAERGTWLETWGLIPLSVKYVQSFQDGKNFKPLSYHDPTTINVKSTLLLTLNGNGIKQILGTFWKCLLYFHSETFSGNQGGRQTIDLLQHALKAS